jgi:hypothetical protein
VPCVRTQLATESCVRTQLARHLLSRRSVYYLNQGMTFCHTNFCCGALLEVARLIQPFTTSIGWKFTATPPQIGKFFKGQGRGTSTRPCGLGQRKRTWRHCKQVVVYPSLACHSPRYIQELTQLPHLLSKTARKPLLKPSRSGRMGNLLSHLSSNSADKPLG